MKDNAARIPRPAFWLREAVEVYIPSLAFIVMFTVFILQIFFRYVLRQPLQWAYEVTVTCYIWLVLLGACYAQRDRKHVVFTMVCDKLSVKPRSVLMFLGNLLMLIAFVYAFVPSVEFLIFMGRQKTSVFKIGLDLVYFAYLPFMVIMIVYILRDLIAEFRIFSGIAGADEVQAFDRASRDDFQSSGSGEDNLLETAKEDIT